MLPGGHQMLPGGQQMLPGGWQMCQKVDFNDLHRFSLILETPRLESRAGLWQAVAPCGGRLWAL